MTEDVDQWIEYWTRQYESGAQHQLVTAARSPSDQWLIADIGVLTDEEIGVDIATIHQYPDRTLSAARTAFATFVAESEIEDAADDGYDRLPIHLVGVSPVTRDDTVRLTTPYVDANTLTTVPSVEPTTAPERTYRPLELTYCCPDGHETTLDQPLYRTRVLSRCGRPECTNEVTADDHCTRVRRVVEFEIEYQGVEIRCVATGRYAQPDAAFLTADRIHLTGIPRLSTATDGTIEPVYELLHAGPA